MIHSYWDLYLHCYYYYPCYFLVFVVHSFWYSLGVIAGSDVNGKGLKKSLKTISTHGLHMWTSNLLCNLVTYWKVNNERIENYFFSILTSVFLFQSGSPHYLKRTNRVTSCWGSLFSPPMPSDRKAWPYLDLVQRKHAHYWRQIPRWSGWKSSCTGKWQAFFFNWNLSIRVCIYLFI